MAGGGRSAPERGGVNSYLFKLIRESIPLTQEQLPPRPYPCWFLQLALPATASALTTKVRGVR